MRRARSLFAKATGRPEIDNELRARAVLKHWAEIVGPLLAERSTPDRYDNGTVWVAVEGSAWAQELRLHSERILKDLRQRAASDTIFTELRFGVRKLPEPPVTIEEPPQIPASDEKLSIQERARRRLERWQGPE